MRTDRGLEEITKKKTPGVNTYSLERKGRVWAAFEQFMKALCKEHILRVTGKETGLTFNRLCCSFKSDFSTGNSK